jgi:multidrug efflux pump subunit AcrA (membrane-fusion protein)
MGRVEVPITASGEVRERQRIEVKAQASGTITDIEVKEGQIVEPDELLVIIDPEEEQQNVDQAEAAVVQAEESLNLAKINRDQALMDKDTSVKLAEAALENAKARLEFAESEYSEIQDLSERNVAHSRELSRSKMEYYTSLANRTSAEADLQKVIDSGPRNVSRAEAEIKRSEAALKSANFRLDDANRRLNNTRVKNEYKRPCRVVKIHAAEGQIVSSATNVVGGTVIMELADVTSIEVEARVDEIDIAKVVAMLREGQDQRDAVAAQVGTAASSEIQSDAQEDQPVSDDGAAEGSPSEQDVVAASPGEQDAPPKRERQYRDEVVVHFDSAPGHDFWGRIVEIAQRAELRSQIITYDVRIVLDETPELESIRLDMQATVNFAPSAEEGVCVPYEAVHKVGQDRYVVKMPDPRNPSGSPIERQVEVGLTDGAKVVIRSGLKLSEPVYEKEPRRAGDNA